MNISGNVDALTVGDVIKRILPYGTELRRKSRAWRKCPEWAADVFAAAASIVYASSCYTEPGIALSRNDAERLAKKARAKLHMETGRRWATRVSVPKLVQDHWRTLHDALELPIVDRNRVSESWKRAALALVAISDEAFAGAGYFPAADDGIANYVWYELAMARKVAMHLPHSMTILASSDVACILPKALTPNVGCTLRSLTHNLAYLPGKGIVTPEWHVNPGESLTKRFGSKTPPS